MAALSVGQRVRIAPIHSDGLARRALLLAADGDSYELEYEDGDKEEAVISTCRISPLQPFEEATDAPPPSSDAVAMAELHKAQGNTLFKLRDASAALERYIQALRDLQIDPCMGISPGVRCLVKPASGGGPVRSAMVMAVEPDVLDVMYEDDRRLLNRSGNRLDERLQDLVRRAEALNVEGGHEETAQIANEAASASGSDGAPEGWSSWLRSKLGRSAAPGDGDDSRGMSVSEGEGEEEEAEEEDGVSRDRVALVVHAREPSLQCALLLNSSKCSLMSKDWPAAIARAGRAERISSQDTVNATKSLSQRRVALVVCTRAALGWQRFGLATTYAAQLLAAPLPADDVAAASATKEARALLRDIQRRVHEVRRSNRRLAKELSEWVQSAMEASGQQETLDLT